MMRHTLTLPAHPRGLYDLTPRVRDVVSEAGVAEGLCHVFLRHTSASLLLQENADPAVLDDLLDWFAAAVPDGGAERYAHHEEGPDDMPAHIRSALTQPSLTLPVTAGDLDLGTWQGLFLFEHRLAPRSRQVMITVLGAGAAD